MPVVIQPLVLPVLGDTTLMEYQSAQNVMSNVRFALEELRINVPCVIQNTFCIGIPVMRNALVQDTVMQVILKILFVQIATHLVLIVTKNLTQPV